LPRSTAAAATVLAVPIFNGIFACSTGVDVNAAADVAATLTPPPPSLLVLVQAWPQR
jgi:hypothetical protein